MYSHRYRTFYNVTFLMRFDIPIRVGIVEKVLYINKKRISKSFRFDTLFIVFFYVLYSKTEPVTLIGYFYL